MGFCLGIIGIAFLPSKQNTLSAQPSGWVGIMPTPTFEGWTRVMIPPDRPLPKESQWSMDVADHTLICAGDGGHEWLRYDREFGDFVLHVEWRLTKRAGDAKYNSGVFVRTDARGLIWYQAQVGNASGGYFFGQNPENGSLPRFSLRSALTHQAVKPAGEWNTYDIRCESKKLILRVNGVVTSEFDTCNNPRGYVGLEAEGSRIEFRHVRIKAFD
jgi:hypothetical protein